MSLILVLQFYFSLYCIAELPPSPPRWSWDTIQLFIHGANNTGPLNETAAKYMSSFPMATIEKFQDATNHPICDPTSTQLCEEDRQLLALKQIRSYSADTRTIFYINSMLNFPQYNLSTEFSGVNEKYLLHDQNNKIIWYGNCGDIGGDGSANTTIFDLSQIETRNIWLNDVKYILTNQPGVVDGLFIDRANVNISNLTFCINITDEKQKQWNDGNKLLAQSTMNLIKSINNDRGILIINNADIEGVNGRMFENFQTNDSWASNTENPNDLIELLNDNGVRITEVHGDRANYNTYSSPIYNKTLAAYLIGVGKYAYYACTSGWDFEAGSGWDTMWQNPDYYKSLGPPVKNATYNNATKTYFRQFGSGTKVYLDVQWKHPCIKWSDGTITGNTTDCERYS
eukprot:49264_1